MNMRDTGLEYMEELISELNKASEAYYNGKEIMSNKHYDDLLAELKAAEEATGVVLSDSPTVNVGAPVTDGLPKFTHSYPAKSLDKTKDISEFVDKFRKGIKDSHAGNDKIVVMYKEDGCTAQAYYKEGKLDKLVTRGNGEVGSVVTHNASIVSGLPITLPYDIDLVVRGEVVMSYQEFNRINELLPANEQYANPRNLAGATLTMLDKVGAGNRHLMFQAFNLVDIKSKLDVRTGVVAVPTNSAIRYSFAHRLKFLGEELGFNVVPYEVTLLPVLSDTIQRMTDNVPQYEYPVDGLVAAMDNWAYSSKLEGTNHHPNIMQGYAFKWADETKETVVRDIEWSPSRTGLLNPVVIFDPVELEGTIVKRASLHNLSIMRKLNIKVGDKITVYKANQIIPQVDRNLDKATHKFYDDNFIHDLIGFCPTCGSAAEVNVSPDGIETVYCPNKDCPEKMIGKLAHFCSRDCMDIQGMSEETITKLVEAGFIKEYQDFFNLDEKPGISFLPGFGKQSWKKMCQSAQKAKSTDFVHFITALGITNIGKGQAKILYKYISANYDRLIDKFNKGAEDYHPVQLFRIMALQNFDFSVINGIGDILSDGIIKWAHDHWEFNTPETHVTIILDFTDKRPSTEGSNSSISGKSFCITGKLVTFKNRQELVSKIEELGGKWVDSVSSKTDYLINNDVTSTSGKNKKAKDLNIPIISEQDFLDMVGG